MQEKVFLHIILNIHMDQGWKILTTVTHPIKKCVLVNITQ